MGTLGQQIKKFRKLLNLTQNSLASALQVPRDTVANWEVNRATTSIEILQKMADFFNTSVDSLLGRDASNLILIDNPIDACLTEATLLRPDNIIVMPVFKSHEFNLPNIPKYIYLQVNDDSMAPQISKGDIIQVHKQSSIDNGNIGVVRLHKSGLAIRRITIINDKILLSADNPAYGQLLLDRAECGIIGQVIKAVKKVR